MWQIIVSLAIGALAGFVANKLMGGKSNSLLRNIIFGLIGLALLGGLIGAFIAGKLISKHFEKAGIV